MKLHSYFLVNFIASPSKLNYKLKETQKLSKDILHCLQANS